MKQILTSMLIITGSLALSHCSTDRVTSVATPKAQKVGNKIGDGLSGRYVVLDTVNQTFSVLSKSANGRQSADGEIRGVPYDRVELPCNATCRNGDQNGNEYTYTGPNAVLYTFNFDCPEFPGVLADVMAMTCNSDLGTQVSLLRNYEELVTTTTSAGCEDNSKASASLYGTTKAGQWAILVFRDSYPSPAGAIRTKIYTSPTGFTQCGDFWP
ncbi:hypothetical protein ACFSUS_22575 [Spirosoma soli]|uniref:Collagen-like protein n=1 Tax=Spirosoma soli TaxID=1770529 RepID=A0ABW5M8Y6_9BACT